MPYPISFIYVWATFEHELQDLYASQKVQVFPSLGRPKSLFGHARGYQRASVLTGSISIIQNTIFTIYKV